jgi:hypothetical protein
MKNLFIVLLIAAIGAGAYLYFGEKKNQTSLLSKELIIGKWAIDSLKGVFTNSPNSQNRSLIGSIDSNLKKGEFEFRNDSMVLQIFDKKIVDTSHYSFANDGTILVWGNADKANEKFTIVALDSSKLSFRIDDSVVFYFRRAPIE